MSLLLRRRALIEACADAVEGGGENDGKYVWIQYGRNSRYDYFLVASADFGQTYSTKNTAATYRQQYSHSIGVDYLGDVYFVSSSDLKAKRSAYNESYPTTIQGLLKTGSANNTSMSFARSFTPNQDASKLLVFLSSTATGPITNLKLLSFENHSRTGSVLLSSSVSGLWTTNINVAGPFVEANRGTLQYVIAGPDANSRRGTSPNSGSISYDYGQTWTKIEDVIFGSQSATPNLMRGAAWTDKGDKCLVCYGSATDSHLYLSKDYGHSFTQLADPPGLENYVRSVFASEKFKTIYVTGLSSSVGVIYRSQDLGRTWTKVKSFSAGASGVVMDCNAKGDKLIASLYSSQTTTAYLSYSLDYGDTWGRSNLEYNYWDKAGLGRAPVMSRDYLSNYSSSEGGDSGSTQYSMSVAEVQARVYSLFTASNDTVEVTMSQGSSIRNLTLSRRSYYSQSILTGMTWEDNTANVNEYIGAYYYTTIIGGSIAVDIASTQGKLNDYEWNSGPLSGQQASWESAWKGAATASANALLSQSAGNPIYFDFN